MTIFSKAKQLLKQCTDATGSTIVELLVATMVVGLIVTAVAASSTQSIKNTGEARFRQVATGLGQEVLEFVRTQRNELGMINLASDFPTGTYCFNTIPSSISSVNTGACGANEVINMAGADFTRQAVVVSDSASTPYPVLVTVTVSWQDGATTRSVELVQEFEKPNTSK